MNLYIKIENGLPVTHPILEDNLIACGISELPNSEFHLFVRTPLPTVGPYEFAESNSYTLGTNGVWTDAWVIRSLTPDEKEKKIEMLQNLFHDPTFVFNEETCAWEPPV